MTAALMALLAQLIPLGMQAYQEWLTANPGSTLPPLADLVNQADANWKLVQQEAATQLAQDEAQLGAPQQTTAAEPGASVPNGNPEPPTQTQAVIS